MEDDKPMWMKRASEAPQALDVAVMHMLLTSPGKFAPRPKSKAQSSDGEGLGNEGDGDNEGPGEDEDGDDGGDEQED